MPRVAKQSGTWDFKVKQVVLFDEDGNDTGFFGNRREDTKTVLGVTSERYGLVQNADFIGTAIDALASAGLTDYSKRILTTNGGARVYAEFTLGKKNLATAVGDRFAYRFIFKNSFDRTLRASMELGFLRLVCANGMTSLEKEFSDSRKHSLRNSKDGDGMEEMTTDFIGEAIEMALERAPKALETYSMLAEREVNTEKGAIILHNLEDKGILSGKVREGILPIWLAPKRNEDKGRNLYNLYNAATEFLTHQVSGDRFEYSRATSQGVLGALARAARDKDTFNKLITMPKDKRAEIKLEVVAPVALSA